MRTRTSYFVTSTSVKEVYIARIHRPVSCTKSPGRPVLSKLSCSRPRRRRVAAVINLRGSRSSGSACCQQLSCACALCLRGSSRPESLQNRGGPPAGSIRFRVGLVELDLISLSIIGFLFLEKVDRLQVGLRVELFS